MREFTIDDTGLFNARLSKVIDCGTIKKIGERCVFLSFQLEDFPIKPQDDSLPVYRKFAKFPYGGMLSLNEKSHDRKILQPILNILGYKSGNVLEFLLGKVGSFIKLNIKPNEYNGKVYADILEEGHEEGYDPNIDWGIDLVTFVYSEDTTIGEIKSLGFDTKYPRKGKEYLEILEKDIDLSIDEVF